MAGGRAAQSYLIWITFNSGNGKYGAGESRSRPLPCRRGTPVFVLNNGETVAILRPRMAFVPRCFEPGRDHQVRPEDVRSLQSFAEDYPESRPFLLYRNKARFKQAGVLGLPCENCLLDLRPDHFPC